MIRSKRLSIPPSQVSTHPRTEINSNGLFHAHDDRELGMKTGERRAVKLL